MSPFHIKMFLSLLAFVKLIALKNNFNFLVLKKSKSEAFFSNGGLYKKNHETGNLSNVLFSF